eukprot:TRINITY_DN17062_c0_g1_i1.p1 TRINITY_DN17062_c0_g1~~TRINITY_DN17062_c0_g1_i1.p1  ORF type:complete len:366 (-),score=56.02 TRINITY_DN17062_c0_g1_i1:186-1283(-)
MANSVDPMEPLAKKQRLSSSRKVCLIGGGSFGSAMGCVVAESVKKHPSSFDEEIRWYVRREELCKEINEKKTNSQYYPGTLSENLVAMSDLRKAAENADVCIIALPADYLGPAMEILKTCLSDSCIVVSLVKSLKMRDGEVFPCSRYLQQELKRPVAALMGPNLYKEMARNEYAEATIGCSDMACEGTLTELFETPRFHVKCISDMEAVDICGCIKNTFTLACGFAAGCGWGGNVKSAIIRRSLCEMTALVDELLPKDRKGSLSAQAVLLEACGVGDLMLSCIYGRGQTLATEFVKRGLSGGKEAWEDLENETMNGMKLPDWKNLQVVFDLLECKGRLSAYPLLKQTHAIAFKGAVATSIVDALR